MNMALTVKYVACLPMVVTADMQTLWEPIAAPIGANSYVGWAALCLTSYTYIGPSSTYLDLQIPGKVLCF